MARSGMQGIAKAMGTTYDEARRVAINAVPLRRISEPQEVAGLVSFFLGPDARSITGAAMRCAPVCSTTRALTRRRRSTSNSIAAGNTRSTTALGDFSATIACMNGRIASSRS